MSLTALFAFAGEYALIKSVFLSVRQIISRCIMSNPFESIEHRLARIEETLSQLASLKVPQPEKKYYTVSEAAQKLNVAEITLYRNGKAGKIPVKKIGSRLMLPGSYVDGFVPSQ
jgi:excisionase family DNA binding protein